jgi:uncharacterized protein
MSELQITGYRCTECGRVHYPRHEQCLDCHSRSFEAIAPEGNVTLLAYTQIFNLPWGFDERFLIIGIAQIENGIKAVGQIRTTSLESLHTGALLKPAWGPIRRVDDEPVFGLVFEPLA